MLGPMIESTPEGQETVAYHHVEPLRVPVTATVGRAVDFISGVLYSGNRSGTFNAVDGFDRESLGIEAETNPAAVRVIRGLGHVTSWRGYPASLRRGNGPEMISVTLVDWAEEHRAEPDPPQPAKPTQKAFIERLNRTCRGKMLDLCVSSTLTEGRNITDEGLVHFNQTRPMSPWAT